ncbi:hypothetical protein RRG08_011669 [Elysia crispata]|uniref:Mutator-like transposase domain-containing protein n=1 Tax=Elysia crispata TaxID=231223 RepID=A0AAE1D0A6_9GAST|nr:hypothetical protein RRG08_011669 [Elysia crispata]
MGNKGKVARAKKRKFMGNQFSEPKFRSSPNTDTSGEEPILDTDTYRTESASARKIRNNNVDLDVQESNGDISKAFILMNAEILCSFFRTTMRCYDCGELGITCELSDMKHGFYYELLLNCDKCNWCSKVQSSHQSTSNGHKEINLRMVSFVRSLGLGYSALENFSLYTNCPRPMSKKCYQSTFSKIHAASKEVAEESMVRAAEEVKTLRGKGDPNSRSSDTEFVDCNVSLDGTWQRRGHSSHHGVVTAISVETGKCLDSEIMSNICKGCQFWEKNKKVDEAGYMKWKLDHPLACKANHKGSAGAMESVGSVRIFSRSEEQRGLRYTEYLGDGDAAAFRKVSEFCPYGEDVEIKKLECVGHVQKRCGTRLRRLKNENKTRKLEDGKGLGGAGRLTDKKIDTLQNYYGFAIRHNAGNLDNMKAAVRAVLPHVASTEANKMHDLCAEGPNSWCKYKADPENYKHKNGLPLAVVGVRCEQYSQQACARKDDSRLYHAAYKTKESTKKRRKVLRAIRKGFQDKATEAEGDLYSAGGH